MSEQASPAVEAAPRRIDDLESLRGLAALLVVFYHMPKWHPVYSTTFFMNGYLMVPLFFVLSGFVISAAYRNRLATGTDFARFQFLRFGRLYPIHLLFLLIFLVIEFMKLGAQKYGIYSNIPPFVHNSLDAFIKNIFLISAVLPHQPTTFNYPAWSISVEFYTYMVFGAIVLWCRKFMDYVFAGFVVLALAAIVFDSVHGFFDLLSCFLGFFLGCLTERIIRTRPWPTPGYVADLLCLGLLAFLVFKTDRDWDPIVYFLSAALVYALVHGRGGLAKAALQHRLLIWLGTISYSLYMSHAAVQWFVAQVVRVVFRRPQIMDAEGRMVPMLDLTEALIAGGVVIALVIGLSAICYYWVERPMREVSRRIASGIGKPAEAALPARD